MNSLFFRKLAPLAACLFFGLSVSTYAKALNLPEQWEYSAPLIEPEKREADPSHAQKDPTIVRHGGKWHVFMTVKLPDRKTT